ncbi:MAG TPA: diacylglycerol kinase family protein [Candidatus Limnocylindria bacterium]|nr:diacylglycerol kinase family protein [Candidatus Limnocylindria bacterium]
MPHAPLVIVNPTAGGGRAARLIPWLRERLERRPDVELFITRRRGDAEERAAAAIANEHDRIIAVGGDGTIQEVLNGALGSDSRVPELGIIPVGTGNDLARSLGLPSDPAAAWRVAVGRSSRATDVARARNGDGNERWFASAGGIGFDAQVAAAMAQRRGWQGSRAGYLLTTLSELRRFENRHVRIALDGQVLERDVLLIAVANGAYYGGGMRIAPNARADDGLLDVCVVGDISRITALRELPNLYRATHVRNPAVSMHTAVAIEVDGGSATRVHLDGEPFGSLPLTIAITPRAIEVAVPEPSARL